MLVKILWTVVQLAILAILVIGVIRIFTTNYLQAKGQIALGGRISRVISGALPIRRISAVIVPFTTYWAFVNGGDESEWNELPSYPRAIWEAILGRIRICEGDRIAWAHATVNSRPTVVPVSDIRFNWNPGTSLSLVPGTILLSVQTGDSPRDITEFPLPDGAFSHLTDGGLPLVIFRPGGEMEIAGMPEEIGPGRTVSLRYHTDVIPIVRAPRSRRVTDAVLPRVR